MPTAWNEGKEFGAHPEHDILVFAVANTCGLDTYLDERQLREGLQEMIVQNGVAFDFAIPQARHTPNQYVYPPRGFEAANMTWPETPSLDPAALQDVYLPQSYAQQLPRLWPIWPRNEIIYTDGSARDTGRPDGYRSGTGVFRFASSRGPVVELCIDPINYHTGVANTIQRAELVGIFKALQVDYSGPNLMICTDSLASMYMIDKHMRCPSLHKECKHEELLSLIVEELAKKAREGVRVQLLKVKSHIGIEGNEKADALAHEACKPECCNDVASEGVEIREDVFWPHFNGKKIHNASRGAAAVAMDVLGGEQPSQADPNRKDAAGQFQVTDIGKGLKKILKAGC